MVIKKFDEYVNENKILDSEIELLEKYNISEYRFNKETNLIDVLQDVDISMQNISKLQIRFGTIYGKFYCIDNKITSLKNFPKEINGNFDCSQNKLTSLEFCPKYVNGNFNCAYNELTSLYGCPSLIEEHGQGFFSCSRNELTSLDHCPRYVYDFIVRGNNIKSCDDYPLSIIFHHIDAGLKSSQYMIQSFQKIQKLVKKKQEIFEHFLDDKIKFHQMVMRLDPTLIPFYKTIPPPSKKSTLLV